MSVESKTCTKCGEVKPFDEFCKAAGRRYGLKSQCKICTNSSIRRARTAYREKYKAASREHYAANREVMTARARRRYYSNMDKVQAKRAVRSAIESGSLTRGSCEVCGAVDNIHGHHDSYAEEHWLNVRWLCAMHHGRHHASTAAVKSEDMQCLL